MQIVIDISEEVYNSIKSNEEIITYITRNGGGSNGLQGSLAIINGIPLSKGHGRLIDENEIKQMIEDAKVKNDFSKTFAENIIKFAPTIIEADKGE